MDTSRRGDVAGGPRSGKGKVNRPYVALKSCFRNYARLGDAR